jgi:hypothetical protein
MREIRSFSSTTTGFPSSSKVQLASWPKYADKILIYPPIFSSISQPRHPAQPIGEGNIGICNLHVNRACELNIEYFGMSLRSVYFILDQNDFLQYLLNVTLFLCYFSVL